MKRKVNPGRTHPKGKIVERRTTLGWSSRSSWKEEEKKNTADGLLEAKDWGKVQKEIYYRNVGCASHDR